MTLATIESDDGLRDLLESSGARPVIIFKHSNACPVSSRAHGEVERFLATHDASGFGFGMVVVQTHREISDAIEARLGIRHESPQIIVVRGGRAAWHASHFDVTSDRIALAVEGV